MTKPGIRARKTVPLSEPLNLTSEPSTQPLQPTRPASSARESCNEISIEEFRNFIKDKRKSSPCRTNHQGHDESFRRHTISGKEEKKPLSWKTTFDIDAPRKSIANSARRSRPTSRTNNSEQQDTWEGIDNLLENDSIDGSVACSTSEILSKATVSAMRKNMTRHSSTKNLNSDTTEKEIYKKCLKESQDVGIIHHGAQGKVTEKRGNPTRKAKSCDNTLFDMFKWSEKQNIDKDQESKRILNHRVTLPELITNQTNGSNGKADDQSSLPSLATFTVSSRPPKDCNSVVTDDSYNTEYDSTIVTDSNEVTSKRSKNEMDGSPKFEGDKIVLDKGVDDYINSIQKNLPTISEDNISSFKKLSLAEKSTGRACVADSSALDDLPFLHDSFSISSAVQEKKEPRPSLSRQVKTKIGKIMSKVQRGGPAGDEEKYFPNPEEERSKRSQANQCLLSEVEDF